MRQEKEKNLKEKTQKQSLHRTPVTTENFLCCKAKYGAELLAIEKK